MPVPKRRHSRSRGRKRRSHDALKILALSPCPQCNEPRLPHHACPNCGYYKGREVLKPRES